MILNKNNVEENVRIQPNINFYEVEKDPLCDTINNSPIPF